MPRLFSTDHVGCTLDAIAHRVKDEAKLVDLTLRIEPFTPALAAALDPDVRRFLFALDDVAIRDKIRAVEFALAVPDQTLTVRIVPELAKGEVAFTDCAIDKIKAKKDKDKPEYLLTVRATVIAPTAKQLEFLQAWHTDQRFVSFHPADPELDLAGDEDSAPTTTGGTREYHEH